MLQIKSFTVGPFAENPYLLTCSETNQALMIDPGDEADVLWQAIVDAGVQLQAIVLTHAHLDHVGALTAIRERAQVPVYLHPADDELLAQVPWQGRMFGFQMAPIAPAERRLQHGDQLQLGTITLDVLHTPGHSPGCVCLYAVGEKTLIAGDTLFYRSVGRTDLPGSNSQQLVNSIHTHLWPLPDDVRVLAGHGPATTIGEEKRLNPFVGDAGQGNRGIRPRSVSQYAPVCWPLCNRKDTS
jgi:glyoxylase-like metal-dependent hydrolase (beta-lactamase superfamily II)